MVSNDGHESLNEEEKKLKEEKYKGGRGVTVGDAK